MSITLASLGEPGPDSTPLLVTIGVIAAAALLWGLALLARGAWRRLTLAPTPSVPVDEWRRRGLHVQRSRGVVEFQGTQRCPLCHVEHAPTSEAARCAGCGALFHLLCARELGKYEISWESHLWGLAAGVALAFVFKKQGMQREIYKWEEDEEEVENSLNEIKISYEFIEKEKKEENL